MSTSKYSTLEQTKLTKTEWESIEIPISHEEKKILSLIKRGYDNINIIENELLSLISYLKIEKTDIMETTLFKVYFKDIIDKQFKKINKQIKESKQANSTATSTANDTTYNTYIDNIGISEELNNQVRLNKANTIRIEQSKKNLQGNEDKVVEFILLDIIGNILKNKRCEYYYYTLTYLMKLKINNLNKYVVLWINNVIEYFKDIINKEYCIKNSVQLIEQNKYIYKYSNRELYSHQKQIFNLVKQPNPKLIFYMAPTGTGKTLTPIGLIGDNKHRVVFVCAARHVGLALAKSCISMKCKVAFAFGCETPDDVKLHYFSVVDAIRNKKTGSILKVDNSKGEKVEIIISDIKSYNSAMSYMLAFNKAEDLILYWDEPTIGMDYEEHPLHDTIKNNWRVNMIPNIILSSATLPSENDVRDTIVNFKSKFTCSAEVHSIKSFEYKKSIRVLNKDNYVMVPHNMCKTHEELVECVDNCLDNLTLLRYMDLGEISKFILYINKYPDEYESVDAAYKINNYFDNVEDITMESVKLYYLKLLKRIKNDEWSEIYNEKSMHYKLFDDTVQITTKGANTLTNGPTIFITQDTDKIAKFCLQLAKIPKETMTKIMINIDFNNDLSDKITVMEKKFDDGTKEDEEKEKKMADGRYSDEMKKLLREIKDAKDKIRDIELDEIYVPNKSEHLSRWVDGYNDSEDNIKRYSDAFTADIDSETVKDIMTLSGIDDIWKILLLMGIGVFKEHDNVKYIEIMKKLADNQRLFMIVASSDYIYGTNYQFCHTYLGKDIANSTNQKLIQAIGRVGRNKLQQLYSIRIRDDDIIKKLFMPNKDNIEANNMNKLFYFDEYE